VAQELVKTYLPWGKQHRFIIGLTVGIFSAYGMTRHNTKVCQQMWLAMEEKHSEITPLQGKLVFDVTFVKVKVKVRVKYFNC
jgi:hypothetical protein